MKDAIYKRQAKKWEIKKMRKFYQVIGITLSIILVAGLMVNVQASFAKDKSKAKDIKIKSLTKEITGMIISFIPMKNPKYISLACGEGEAGYDINFEVDENVQIIHKQDLDQIKLGDTVTVEYEKATYKGEDDKERVKHVAKIIRFVRAAREKLRPEPGEIKEPEVSGDEKGRE